MVGSLKKSNSFSFSRQFSNSFRRRVTPKEGRGGSPSTDQQHPHLFHRRQLQETADGALPQSPPSSLAHRLVSPSRSAGYNGGEGGGTGDGDAGDSASSSGTQSPARMRHSSGPPKTDHNSSAHDMPLGECLASSLLTSASGSCNMATSNYGDSSTDSPDGLFSGNTSRASPSPADSIKLKQMATVLRSKIMDTMQSIKQAQEKKEENVYKYLSDATREDPLMHVTKSKAAFEKQNQKSGLKIAHLQNKLEKYRKRLELLESGVVPDKQHPGLEILRDVGQGLSRVVSSRRLLSESSPSPTSKEIGKGFGSADDITGGKTKNEAINADGKLPRTLPADFKYHSDEDTSVTVQTAVRQEQQPAATDVSSTISTSGVESTRTTGTGTGRVESAVFLTQLGNSRKLQESLLDSMEIYRVQTNEQLELLKQEIDAQKQRVGELETHILEFADCRRADTDNFRQELARLEERGDYRLEERVRDMQDMLDNCRNRITKMETQSLSLDLMEATNYSLVVTKLINVVLALLAVIFVLISAVAGLVQPLYVSSGRLAVTCCALLCFFILWRLWPSTSGLLLKDRPHDF